MTESYNPHGTRRVLCRQQRLRHHQVPLAIDIIESTEKADGEVLHGVIHWKDGLVLDDSRIFVSDEELMNRKYPEDGPFYTFRYDGNKLELFKH